MIAFFTYLYILEFTPYQLIETFHFVSQLPGTSLCGCPVVYLFMSI